jgi:PhoPQ-activated pathogenicity-related protein
MRHQLRCGLILSFIALMATSLDAKESAAPHAPPAASEAAVPSPALADYIAQPDASYRWRKRSEGQLGNGTYVEIILTSQTWRDIVWKHQLFIYRPSVVESKAQAMLLIAGGRWRDSLEDPPDAAADKLPGEANAVATVAEMMRAPVAVLLQVPEQPLFGGMVEDEIISHTFAEFMKTGDAQWPLLLPMVKSAVRGMDAVQEFVEAEWGYKIEDFLVTGASKRGWTTWLTAAVDPRVNALAPMVIDMLNMRAHMDLQELSFGGYSEQIRDYTDKNLQHEQDSERAVALRAIVDPFSYRQQLRQPKLIILGTNDRYWPVDALNLYWNDLAGEKYILYVPNNGHGIRDYARVLGTTSALHEHVSGKKPLPKLSWNFADRGDALRLEVSSDTRPVAVTSWTTTSKTRDFREATWVSRAARRNEGADPTYVIDLEKPTDGFAAVFAEAQFNDRAMPFYLSTNLQVVHAASAGSDAGGN